LDTPSETEKFKKWIAPQIVFFFALTLIVILGAVKHIPKMFKSLIKVSAETRAEGG